MNGQNNVKCKYPELHCPYQGCMNKNECTHFNVRSNGGDFGAKVCMTFEGSQKDWNLVTPDLLPPKSELLLVMNKHGEVFEFTFWAHCNVLWSAKLMGIIYFKLARY